MSKIKNNKSEFFHFIQEAKGFYSVLNDTHIGNIITGARQFGTTDGNKLNCRKKNALALNKTTELQVIPQASNDSSFPPS